MFSGRGEQGYLDLLAHIMENGEDRMDRTGVGTREIFGAMLEYDCSDGTVPIFTTKRVYWKTALRELLWMLSGSGNIRPLLEQDVHIWSEWPHDRYMKATGNELTLEAFEQRILSDSRFAETWGDTGRAYGVQWRKWANYVKADMPGHYVEGPGVDQIQNLLDQIKHNPNSRRIMFTAWNAAEVDGMILPPCHHTYQINVSNGCIDVIAVMRSADSVLGLPFNSFNASALLYMIAGHCGLSARKVVMQIANAHIYSNHFDQVREILTRDVRPAPRLTLRERDDFFAHVVEDFSLEGYDPHPPVKAPIAV